MAIAKGKKDAEVVFSKAVSLRYLGRYAEAMKHVETAIQLDTAHQKYLNEKGLIYYRQEKPDEALKMFEQAKLVANGSNESYYWIAVIHHDKKELEKALASYYEAKANIPVGNPYYTEALIKIGELEFDFTKNYTKSAIAFSEAITFQPKNFELYPKLIKAYNANGEYDKADSAVWEEKMAYQRHELSFSGVHI